MIFLALIFFAGQQKVQQTGKYHVIVANEHRSLGYNFCFALSMYYLCMNLKNSHGVHFSLCDPESWKFTHILTLFNRN